MKAVIKIMLYYEKQHGKKSLFVAGFVELQMEKLDVVDSFGTIPFLDYKHYVLRAFFPEVNGCCAFCYNFITTLEMIYVTNMLLLSLHTTNDIKENA